MGPYRLPENPNSDDYKKLVEYYKENRNKYKINFIISFICLFISIGIIIVLIAEKKKEFSLIERLSDQKNCISFEKISIPVMIPTFVEKQTNNEEDKYRQLESDPCRDQTQITISNSDMKTFYHICPHPSQALVGTQCFCQNRK